MTPMTAAMIVAAVANIAAVIAMLFARRAMERAFSASELARSASSLALSDAASALRAMESVSSSRVSRFEDEASSRSACCSASQALASAPTSSVCCARTLVRVSPLDSNAERCTRSLGMVGARVNVMPNVRVKPAPTAWRGGQHAHNGPQAQRMMAGATSRWGSA